MNKNPSATPNVANAPEPTQVPVFDLYEKSWYPNGVQVVYRNNPLSYIFPDMPLAIGDVLGHLIDEVPIEEVAKILDKGWVDEEGRQWQLIGAGSHRKRGRALYTCDRSYTDAFTRFFGSNANAINYGSNLTTECQKLITLGVSILIVDDGEYGTGDCHAKASSRLFKSLGMPCYVPFQFRAVETEQLWVAKGTIAFSPKVDQTEYDLVIPRSAFKGNSPGENGECSCSSLVFGVVHVAKQREVNLSYSVVQFLPWEAVEKDILPATLAAAGKILTLADSPRKLTEYLIDSDEGDDQEYLPVLHQIIKADGWGQLVPHHPWVIERINRLLRRRWLKLATSGGARFKSFMCMPDNSIPYGQVCVPDLPTDKDLIVHPYPCCWKHEIRVVKNVHSDKWRRHKGVFVASEKTLLDFWSRDSDGDFIQCILASDMPNVAQAVREFGEPPALKAKPPKERAQGSLGSIAVRAMDNQVGLITHLIAKAQASGNEHLIPQLAQQLQIEVDSLKNVARADMELVEELTSCMKKSRVSWLSDLKKSEVFVKRSLIADKDGIDTISKLATWVGQQWQPPHIKSAPLVDFACLFDKPPKAWIERAQQRRTEYISDIRWAHKPAETYKGQRVPPIVQAQVDWRRKQIFAKWRSWLDKCPAQHRPTAAAAIWYACHSSGSRSASFAFTVCLPEILERLSQLRIPAFNIFHLNLNPGFFSADPVVVEVFADGTYKKARLRGGELIGSVPNCVPDGIIPVRIKPHCGKSGTYLKATVVEEQLLEF